MYKENYEKWISSKHLNTDLRIQLLDMSPEEREDAFYKDLEFGTGGMRGILGPGTNRMNVYTIRKANVGFATYLSNRFEDSLDKGVVIAYDNRHMSRTFAQESAQVLATFGIKSYLFDTLRPTPELSFAVRHLDAIGGIVVTASHNPPNYNGYKIYDEDGCQLTPDLADQVIEHVNNVEDVFTIDTQDFFMAKANGMVEEIGPDIDKAYLEAVSSIQLQPDIPKNLHIVFTPLHGTSAMIGVEALRMNGYEVTEVLEQMANDPDFGTVKSPNPENKEAFELAIRDGKRVNADILIATDPDADRLGVAVLHNGEYKFLTGNQTGAIMVNYILHVRKELGTLPQKGMVFNTVVTSELGAKIATSYGMDVTSTLTGFKYIGEQAKLLEDSDTEFMFGYEESYGYVIKDFVRDKDSIQAALMISEIANVYKQEGMTLYDALEGIFDTYGTYYEDLVSVQLEGKSGQEKIEAILSHFRTNAPSEIVGKKVVVKEDYLLQERTEHNTTSSLDLPKSNVLKFFLEDGSWFVLRPSGTEPKLKIYCSVVSDSLEQATKYNNKIIKRILQEIDNIK